MTVGIGIVGSGFMGRTLAFAVRRVAPQVALRAVFGGRRAATLAAEHDVTNEPSLDALLARGDVDAVLVASPTFHHRDHVVAAARAGRHVFCETPLAISLADVDAMLGACRDAGVVLAAEAVSRYRTGVRRAHDLIAAGALGEVRMLRFTNAHPVGGHHAAADWLADPHAGSPFLDQGVHSNDVLRWFAGADAVLCFARYGTYTDVPPPAQSAMVTYAFANGAMAQAWVSDEWPAAPGSRTSEYLVVGSRAMLAVQLRGSLRIHRGDRWRTLYTHPEITLDPPGDSLAYPYVDQLRDFAAAIEHGGRPEMDGESARRAIEMALAADQSARTGTAVTLPLRSP